MGKNKGLSNITKNIAGGLTLGATSKLGLNDRVDKFFGQGSGVNGSGQSGWAGIDSIEAKAGAVAPKYQSLRDINGDLLSKYKMDPFSGAASQKLRNEALSSGPSEWATNALNAQGFEESQGMGRAGLQSQAATSGAQSQLARMGGLGGGARTSLARSGARDLLNAKQGVAAQGIQSRYGINDQDMKRRQELLGTTADVERQGDLQNLGTLTGDVRGQSEFDMNRYNTIMQAWAANQTANATAAAGNKAGGGKK